MGQHPRLRWASATQTFGTLTVGRQYAFCNDLASQLRSDGRRLRLLADWQLSSTPVGGLGDTEMARYNTSVKYQVQYQAVRAGAMYEFGDYSWGNGANGAYQFDLGADYAGFSVDAIYSHANDAVFLSALSGIGAVGLGLPRRDDRRCRQLALAAKYKTGAVPGLCRLRLRPAVESNGSVRRRRRGERLHRNRRLRRTRQWRRHIRQDQHHRLRPS